MACRIHNGNLYKWVKCGRYRRFSILKSMKAWQGFNVFAALIWNNKFINFQVGKHGFFIHLSTDKRFNLECLESFRPVCDCRVTWNYVSAFFNQKIWLFLFSWTPWYALYLEYSEKLEGFTTIQYRYRYSRISRDRFN